MNDATEQGTWEDDAPGAAPFISMPMLAAADLQDHLMTATNDLDRLQTLLNDACGTLMQIFSGATDELRGLDRATRERAMNYFGNAVTALQFQDMASQLIAHTHSRLRNCVDRLARDAIVDDEDGIAVVEEMPLRPNPVTQSEMEAGSVELF